MKMKMLLMASAGLSVALGAGFIGCKRQQPPPVKVFTADSPLDMGGGSIYGNLYNGQQWPNSCNESKSCTMTSSSIDQIVTIGVNPANSYSVPPPPQPNGWVMKISNRHKDKTEKNDAVIICSNPNCDGNDLGDGHTIYLATRGDSRFTLYSATQLRFHDNDCDGASGTSEDQDCDFFEKVKIFHPAGTEVWKGKCQGPRGEGYCDIQIGK
jgi:hypothetical protein